MVFLDNSWGDAPVTTQVKGPDGVAYPTAGPLTLAPGEIVPIVENSPLCPGVRIDMAAARILGIHRQGHDTTLIVYGPPASPLEVRLRGPLAPNNGGTSKKTPGAFPAPPLLGAGGHPEFVIKTKAPVADGAFQTYTYYAGKEFVRVLVMNDHLADRTWFVPLQNNGQNTGRSAVVIGPDYVGDAEINHGHLVLQTERRSGSPAMPPKASLFLDDDPGPRALTPTEPFHPLPASARVPALGPWQVAPGAAEAQPGYNDAAWLASPDPLPMGADGDRSAYAWYRSVVHAPSAGTYNLDLSDAGDWVSAFVNGVHTVSSDIQQRKDAHRRRVRSGSHWLKATIQLPF